jgi:hypothetical protein
VAWMQAAIEHFAAAFAEPKVWVDLLATGFAS